MALLREPRLNRSESRGPAGVLLGLLLVVLGLLGCGDSAAPGGDPSAEASESPSVESNVTATAGKEKDSDQVSPEAESSLEPVKDAEGEGEPDLPEASEPQEQASGPKPPEVSAPTVSFPEMKMSERTAEIRALFIQANRQFLDQKYVEALQTLAKLDALGLEGNEERALDLFLKRIEAALNEGEESASTPVNE